MAFIGISERGEGTGFEFLYYFMFSLDTKEADFLCFCPFNHKIMIFSSIY